MIESNVLVQSLHLKHFLCQGLPLASTSSAAKTTPPQRGQPCPGGALMMAVSITVVFGACSLQMTHTFEVRKYSTGKDAVVLKKSYA